MTDASRHMGVLPPMLSHPAVLWTVENAARPKRKRTPYSGPSFRYLSFGAGVQSTCLLAMTVLGLRDCPRADVAIFADTGDEPAWVYSHQHIQDYHRLMGKYGEWLRKDGLLGAWGYDLILHPSRHEAKENVPSQIQFPTPPATDSRRERKASGRTRQRPVCPWLQA